MKILEDLNKEEVNLLLKFPAYISLLAINNEKELDRCGKKEAIKFAHVKTYSCNPLLSKFYYEADRVFVSNLTELECRLPKVKEEREKVIKEELLQLETILKKLGDEFTETMHRSMNSFKNHVSKAHRNVLEDFIFPIPIKGING